MMARQVGKTQSERLVFETLIHLNLSKSLVGKYLSRH